MVEMNPVTTQPWIASEVVEAIKSARYDSAMHPWEDVSVGVSRGKLDCCWIEDAHLWLTEEDQHQRMIRARFP